jgi:hypothetical protein
MFYYKFIDYFLLKLQYRDAIQFWNMQIWCDLESLFEDTHRLFYPNYPNKAIPERKHEMIINKELSHTILGKELRKLS